jgi:hypothetical protein
MKALAKRKAGRPKKPAGAPVDHRLSDAMKAAIELLVSDNLSRKEASEAAGISEDSIPQGAARETRADSRVPLKLIDDVGGGHTSCIACAVRRHRGIIGAGCYSTLARPRLRRWR